jgi:hypothetical protein
MGNSSTKNNENTHDQYGFVPPPDFFEFGTRTKRHKNHNKRRSKRRSKKKNI